jgi:hypothetical protein
MTWGGAQFEAQRGIEVRILRPQAETARRQHAEAAPFTINHLKDVAGHFQSGTVSRRAHRPGIGVFQFGAAFLQLAHAALNAVEQVDRFESRDHHGHLMAVAECRQFVHPGDCGGMPGGQKPLHFRTGRAQDEIHRGSDQDLGNQQREIADSGGLGLIGRHRVGRRGGFKANGKKHHFAGGFAAGQRQRIQRRIHDPHIAARGLRMQQVALPTGHAQHVTKRAQDHFRPPGQGHRLVDQAGGSHADRATGAMNQPERGREEAVDTKAQDRMGLPAANLHQRPRPGDDAGEFGGKGTRRRRIAVFFDEFHGGSSDDGLVASVRSCNSSISFKISQMRAASSGSIRCSAKPTWTST